MFDLKKVCALGAALVMAFSLCACGDEGGKQPEKPSAQNTQFDENKIVLSFSAMSDVHQQKGYPLYSEKLTAALRYAEELNGKPLDLALFAGDLTENTWKYTGQAGHEEDFTTEYNCEVELLKNAVDEALDLDKTAVFYCLGNHDSDPGGIGGAEGEQLMAQMPKLYHDMLGEQFFWADQPDSEPEKGRRHAVVNGYHFLAVQPEGYWGLRKYSKEMLDWLDSRLAEITQESPEQYVFVTAHPPMYETVWGSYAMDWSDIAVRDILEKYPQAFYLAGHIHGVLQEEVQISQNGYFTAVDCGGVRGTGMMNHLTSVGSEQFSNALTGTHVNDFSQGLLLQVDENGNMRILRCDYTNRSIIKQPWEISHPMADNSHLLRYDNETREEADPAPVFSEDAQFTVTYEQSKLVMNWSAATDDDQVRYYKIIRNRIENGKETREKTYNIATFTYLYDRVEDMPKQLSYDAGVVQLPAGEYRFDCIALDAWDKRSEMISTTLFVS